MEPKQIDATGLRCPQPLMKLTVVSSEMMPGEILEIVGDCPTFELDVRAWCKRLNKNLLLVRKEDGYRKTIRIRL